MKQHNILRVNILECRIEDLQAATYVRMLLARYIHLLLNSNRHALRLRQIDPLNGEMALEKCHVHTIYL